MFWAGVVLDSVVIGALEMQNRVHPNHDPSRFGHLTHHVVLLKECVVEVVAEAISVQRFEGTRLDAATAAMGGYPTPAHRQFHAPTAAWQCVGVAAFQVARTHGFAALPDLARFENPADLLGGRGGQLNGHAPSSRLEDLVAGVRSATSTPNDD